VQVEDFSRDASRIFRPLQYERYVILKTVVVSGGIRTEGWLEEGDAQGKNDRGSETGHKNQKMLYQICEPL
jgi:hypothetical protein